MKLLKKPEGEAGSARPAILICAFVALGGIIFGYDTGTIGGILAMDYWIKLFSTDDNAQGQPFISTGQQSLIVSILSVGTFFGALSGAPIGDRAGRRLGIMLSCLIFDIGVVLQAASTAIPLFVAGRAIAGFGVGLISALIPLYQSECSPKWIRGTMIAAYQLSLTVGLLLAAIVNNATHAREDSGSYRIPIAIQLLYGLTLGIGIFFLPETPRFFIRTGARDKAAKSLGRFRSLPADHPAIQSELAEIVANHEYELSLSATASWVDILKNNGRQRRRLLTGCGVMAGSQLTGINFVFYYGTQFFKNSGIQNPFLIGLTTNLVNVASTAPALIIVERWGRRPLLFWGAVGMTVCEFIIAIVGVTSSSDVANKVLIAFTCFYIFFYAAWGTGGWVVVGENFSLRFRAQSIACSIACNWIFNWAIGYATPYLVDETPGAAGLKAKVFFIWGTCCLGCAVFVWLCIFETRGLTLEQVDDMYEKVSQAWHSPSYTPQVSFQEQLEKQGLPDAAHVEALP